MNKKFLRFRYAAIKRYGDRNWIAHTDYMEFNPCYTVGCGGCERGDFGTGNDRAFIVELSNGTKFLCFMHNYGDGAEDEVLSEKGEVANSYADNASYANVRQNIHKLIRY